jgi:proteic killer suppression protein
MIISFRCKNTEELYFYGSNKKLPSAIHRVALRKLFQVDMAETLRDLQAPPNNKLEALKGDRFGQHSIRINDQWRLCFVWEGVKRASNVEIVDYH